MDEAYHPGRQERSTRIAGSMVQDLASGAVVGELLNRQGSPDDVLGENLSGSMIAAVQAHGVVN